ncbi:TylF/MycF/NovP-related O-methyltransferase [Lacibacterium aquatile]|uniref:TylF/MycF/NovP-related O-methyltransferase n=1 Tax=Lacibacterium aquatile TaxID=1168082 RepID=A0ABW5DX72_9PROT
MNALAERYLKTIKQSLSNDFYIELEGLLHYMLLCQRKGEQPDGAVMRDLAGRRPDILEHVQRARADGSMILWPQEDGSLYDPRNFSEHVHTMVGRARLDHLHHCLDAIRTQHIKGDLIETGVWRGGATIFMRAYLAAHSMTDQIVWVADSFEGLPVPSVRQDIGYDISAAKEPILAISEDKVRALFQRYDLLDDQVRFLKGWFRDSLPAAPIERLALLRLDGDLYESTMDALLALYDKVVPGGFIVIDDYGALPPCKQAIEDFRAERGITDPIHQIDWTGAFWRKPGWDPVQVHDPDAAPSYYSPVVDRVAVRRAQDRIFKRDQPLDGLSFDFEAQRALLEQLTPLANDLPFQDQPVDGLRYGYRNDYFSYFDAILMASMIRLHRPKRVMEIGSGHSSCVILDVNDRYFEGAIECSFIEPYPERLQSLLRPGENVHLHALPVQEVDLAVFDRLEAGDILFIDSTHVSKTGSDVNHNFFKIFPRLAPGVLICLHDVFHPFEYPKYWVLDEHRSWNELYLLRAFLSYNSSFETVFFSEWFEHQQPGLIVDRIPKAAGNLGGCFWMRKTATNCLGTPGFTQVSKPAPAFEECQFYHSIELQGREIKGQWDLRYGLDGYLGGVDFKDKSVLEIGPASGFLTFHMEKSGATVTAVEPPMERLWDCVPMPDFDLDAWRDAFRGHIVGVRNSFWYLHHHYGSSARLIETVPESIPAAVGDFDIGLLAAILLHTRSPISILESVAKRVKNTMIVTELDDPAIGDLPASRLVAWADWKQVDTWWSFSPAFFIQALKLMGFPHATVYRHHQKREMDGVMYPLFTVVAHRTAPAAGL